MVNSERYRMLELGQWLQDYLNPGITAKGYRKLAQEFIRLYNVDFKISRDDVTLRVFGLMDKTEIDNARLFEIMNNSYAAPPEEPLTKLHSLAKKLGLNSEDNPWKIKKPDHNKKPDHKLNAKEKEFMGAVNIICEDDTPPFESLKNLVKFRDWGNRIQHACGAYESMCWAQHGFERLSPSGGDLTIETLPKRMSDTSLDLYTSLTDSFHQIFHQYNNLIVERLLIRDGKFQKAATFSDNLWYTRPIDERPSAFPWEVAASRIFFDFLFAGGQDHFKFCDYCGAFTVIRRKDSKRFCSDRCRAQHRHDQIATSQ